MKDPIEEALERLQPSELAPEFMARLTAARPQPPTAKSAFWLRWLMPLAAGSAAAVLCTWWLRQEPAGQAQNTIPSVAAVSPIPIESNDFLVGAREVGVVVGPNQRPYRVMEVEWLEQDIIRPNGNGPAFGVETKRRDVIPVALEIF